MYVIGTMNTADRSIALLDTALRRRFGFIELMADPELLGEAVAEGIPLGPWLVALNRRICEFIGRDARNLQIGHSYLMHGGRPITRLDSFVRALREDILPLLQECTATKTTPPWRRSWATAWWTQAPGASGKNSSNPTAKRN